MKKLYSQMSRDELESEMLENLEAAARAEFQSQKELFERKYYTAKAYTLNPADFPPGIYAVEGQPGTLFQLKYLNGIMGWGTVGAEAEASFLISMLTPVSHGG
ncbi:DUF1811 family protein [Paenibacillus xerothermodurans]|uniref:DUF1811 family protein n=1 Tax=Paenibacillus xerothermodurans TaxID=1977292 RepID=A0A2W1NFY0_PAEXE|nr:DUF1811 family protein [Paenibacillus xerothermodurans]PZE22590.1 DUF1811 family protein [Paenibacillus xerothermodurans]